MDLDISRLLNKKVLVVGDIMVDTYYIGKVKRISPEAPVPVVLIKQTYSVLGGAANVIQNLVSLGCNSCIIGLIGNDSNGEYIKKNLADLKVENHLIYMNNPTITKTRVVGNNQQIVRIDFEEEKFILPANEEMALMQAVKSYIPCYDVIVISDYGKGVCSHNICQEIIQQAQKYNKPIIIDPKGSNWNKYTGATIITPNLKELSEIVGKDLPNEDEIIHEYSIPLLAKYQLENVLVTRSEKGMSLCNSSEPIDIKTEAKEVFDVSGAGDTVVATLSAALAASFSLRDAVYLSNKAAGIVVGKRGTSPIHYSELEKEISN